ncbi:ASCH domain-containing protein [Variovorax sp. DT-64]|uniref:ASCH domain-containing protein n=1 Tax=Variovorax sp. DT-64 TaxID=3396160 RepID=UPI003F1AE7C2
MSPFPESSPPPGGRAVLLSVKPRYADLIVAGTKQVEFRRVWAQEPVPWIAVYSSTPTQQIVGIVEVESVVLASASTLWTLNGRRGGGLTRTELRSYFAGKPKGYAVMLGRVLRPHAPVEPADIMQGFRAPQSFRYLTDPEVLRLSRSFLP